MCLDRLAVFVDDVVNKRRGTLLGDVHDADPLALDQLVAEGILVRRHRLARERFVPLIHRDALNRVVLDPSVATPVVSNFERVKSRVGSC